MAASLAIVALLAPCGVSARPGGVPEATISRGKLLVAARHLDRRSGFARSVILIVDHGPDGSTGVIVNRPSEMKLTEVLPSREDVKKRGDDLWFGGPVQPTRILLLARAPERLPEAFPVFDEVQVILTKFGMDRALGRGIPPAAVRAYAGFAGWASGQLEGEIGEGDWHVVDARVKDVFSRDPSRVWEELEEKAVARRWVRLSPHGRVMTDVTAGAAGTMYDVARVRRLPFKTRPGSTKPGRRCEIPGENPDFGSFVEHDGVGGRLRLTIRRG